MEIGDGCYMYINIYYVRPHFSSPGMVLYNVGGVKLAFSKTLVTNGNGH